MRRNVYSIGRERAHSGLWFACEIVGAERVPVRGPYSTRALACSSDLTLRTIQTQALIRGGFPLRVVLWHGAKREDP